MLTIAEQLLLLGLNDKKGSVVFSASNSLPYGLAGALIFDLYFQNRIRFEGKNIYVVSRTTTSNEIADEALYLLYQETKVHNVKYWVKRIHDKIKNLGIRLADRLVEEKILEKKEHHFLWVDYSRYPTRDAVPEREVRNTIRNIVLYDQKPAEKEMALVCLVQASGLINEIFSKEERKKAREKIKKITEGNEVGKATSAIISEINAAMIAVISSATIVTSSHNH